MGGKAFTPKSGESVRHIELTPEDRKRHAEEFREEKKFQQQQKEERFEAIRKRRGSKKSGGSGGNGINIKTGKDL